MSKYLVNSLLLAACVGTVQAQTNAFELEKFKLQQVGINNENVALLKLSEFQNIGETSIFYNNTSGEFKHPLLASKSQFGGFQSERYQSLKQWKFYGKFGLDFGTDKGVSNSTQLNPLRLNPFIIVDSLSGEWTKQNYALETKIVSPTVGEHFTFGLGLDYKVSTGARQRDPRPENTNSTLTLRPAVIYTLDSKNTIGISGKYQNFVEDFTVSNVNTTTVHNMYKLIGVGEYIGSTPIFISTGTISRRYDGNLYGGGLQYALVTDKVKLTVETFLNYNKEKAIDGTSSNPQRAGDHEYKEYGARFEALLNKSSLQHRFNLFWSQKDINNTEFHQYQDPVTREYITLFSNVFNTNLVTNAALNYDLAQYRATNLSWKLGANMSYSGWDNRYSVNKSQQTVDRLTYGLSFKKYFSFEDKSAFAFQVNPSFSQAIDTKFAYDEKSYSTNFVAKNILYPTNDFLASNYYAIGASVQYIFKPSKTQTQFYVKLSENYIKPAKTSEFFSKSQDRLNWQIAIGLLTF